MQAAAAALNEANARIAELTAEGARKQAHLDQIARLAKDSLDGRFAEGEELNVLNAIYWHAIDKAEPDTNLSESISSGGIDGSDADRRDPTPAESYEMIHDDDCALFRKPPGLCDCSCTADDRHDSDDEGQENES